MLEKNQSNQAHLSEQTLRASSRIDGAASGLARSTFDECANAGGRNDKCTVGPAPRPKLDYGVNLAALDLGNFAIDDQDGFGTPPQGIRAEAASTSEASISNN